MRLFALSSSLILLFTAVSADSGGLYPPGLLPLINRANALLSTGQFSEAAKVYSEAIEQSPSDYLLYYKRATAYFSLSRHSAALEDFDKVLSLTSDSFDNAYLMKARIMAKEGEFTPAKMALDVFLKRAKDDSAAKELAAEIEEADKMANKAAKERKAQLWNACIESSSAALRTSSHSVEIRQIRAECSLAAGDFEGATGDLTRLSHLLPPSTTLLQRIFRLTFFYLPASPAALNNLKQCLHYDPDSKPCLSLHRLAKSLDKAFTKLEELTSASDWAGVIKLLAGSGKNNDAMNRFDEALASNTQRDQLILDSPSTTRVKESPIPLPDARKLSPRRQTLVRALCKAYVQTGQVRKAEEWCETLLKMEGCAEDVDGLVGRAEALMKKEEWEDAVRVYEKAFEVSGRSDRDIHQRLSKAQKLLKQSRQKDYYKVLGVSRDADQRTIKKAFRKAAMVSHPDKGGSEAKMAAVNEAYEVLSNPELRQRFDQGDDPNDPMAQHGGQPFFHGQHPFAQFFQQGGGGPGGSGGFQFHFQG
ncbi:hypothetical protein C8J56DRAFT_1011058 [Mycena floridula]|nr:hypothetical protein C8J56DRAFT_1011058 [Mycena floridula]